MGLKNWKEKIQKAAESSLQQTFEIAKKAQPLADDAVNAAGDKAKNAIHGAADIAGTAADIVTGGAQIVAGKASEKAQEIKDDNAKKPSTGSGLLDLLVPGVPNTAATKPKAEKDKKNPSPKP